MEAKKTLVDQEKCCQTVWLKKENNTDYSQLKRKQHGLFTTKEKSRRYMNKMASMNKDLLIPGRTPIRKEMHKK